LGERGEENYYLGRQAGREEIVRREGKREERKKKAETEGNAEIDSRF